MEGKRILLLPKNVGKAELKIITLPHPRTDLPVRFIVQPDQVLELQKVSERYRAWFMDNYVMRDGSLFLATIVDPLFLLIPLLKKNRKETADSAGYFCELDQILSEDQAHPGYAHFMEWPSLPLHLVCDVKDAGNGKIYYRLDDTKVIKWLQAKVIKMKNYLSSAPGLASSLRSGARATNYRDSSPLEEADLLKAALGLISDYIKVEWQIKLCESLGIAPVHVPVEKSALQAFNTNQSVTEKACFGSDEKKEEWEDEVQNSLGDATAKGQKQAPQKSLAQKKLDKVDKRGMTPLTSFFSVKKKET